MKQVIKMTFLGVIIGAILYTPLSAMSPGAKIGLSAYNKVACTSLIRSTSAALRPSALGHSKEIHNQACQEAQALQAQVFAHLEKKPQNLSAFEWECLYKDSAHAHERQAIKNAARAHFEIPENIVTAGPLLYKVPSFLLDEIPHAETISDHHYKAHSKAIAEHIFTHEAFKEGSVQEMFLQAYAKQKEEQAHNKYLFYHARMAVWDFFSDLKKCAYNIAHQDKEVGDDYVFLRFGKGKSDYTHATKGADALWMNAALYGNISRRGSCTASLVLHGHDMSYGPARLGISPKTIFTEQGLQKYYPNCAQELTKLQQLHHEAHDNGVGNLLGISIPEHALERICIPQIESRKLQAELIKNKQIDDTYEFVLPLTADYALDPKKGPRMYSFNATDQEKYAEYAHYRDQLFAKLARDVQD